jgi:hypothetical protein
MTNDEGDFSSFILLKKGENTMGIVGSLWCIAWGNPYVDPPPPGLKVLARIFVLGHSTYPPEELKAIKSLS